MGNAVVNSEQAMEAAIFSFGAANCDLTRSKNSTAASIDIFGNQILVNLSSIDMLKTGIDPLFKADRDVFFYIYTQKNPTVPQKISNSTSSIIASNFNSSDPTRILIHGLFGNIKTDFYTEVVPAYLSRGDFNVVSKILWFK